MALQPEDLDKDVENYYKKFLTDLEATIDKYLKNAYANCNPSEISIAIDFSVYHNLNCYNFKQLQKMYSGWKIKKYTSQDYDGDNYYLIFSDKRKVKK